MRIFFSPSTNGFYPDELKQEYLKSNTWPGDLIEVEYSAWVKYGIGAPPDGKKLHHNGESFVWIDIGQTDLSSNIAKKERFWRDKELKRADIELYKVQDGDVKAFGSVSAWRDYRKALRAWPEKAEFPKQEFRPKAPDAK